MLIYARCMLAALLIRARSITFWCKWLIIVWRNGSAGAGLMPGIRGFSGMFAALFGAGRPWIVIRPVVNCIRLSVEIEVLNGHQDINKFIRITLPVTR